MTEKEAGPSSSNVDSGMEDIVAEAIELLGQGKRNLVVGDPPAAVQCLQEACALFAAKYGEMADECSEAYYQYGCALLELASMENGVLGNALQGVPDESADSEEEDDDEQKSEKSNVEPADKLEAKERDEVIQQVKDALEATCEAEGQQGSDKDEGTEEEEMETEEKEGKEKDEAKEKDEVKGDKEVKDKDDGDNKEKDNKDVEKTEADKQGEKKKDKEKDEKTDKAEKKGVTKKGKNKDEEKMDESSKTPADTDAKAPEEKSEDSKKKKDEDDDDGAGPSTEEPDTTEGEEEGEKQKEDPDDISNFQLAWEMLELARIIMSKNPARESQLKVSQIHLKLGELGLETEQYIQSIVDFNSCLEIQKKYLDPQSRLLAGTHYNLGLAYSFDSKFDDSIEHYRLSKQIMEERLASLEKKIEQAEGKGKEKADDDDPIVKDQKEIDELKELIPDIVSKLEDAKEMKRNPPPPPAVSSEAGCNSSSGFGTSSGFAPSTSSGPVTQIQVKKSAPATDISHLVRRNKRKPEEEAESAPSADSKRSRTEEADKEQQTKAVANGSGDAKATNGDGQVNGHCNGDGQLSPEKPPEFKTKSATSDTPAAMETV